MENISKYDQSKIKDFIKKLFVKEQIPQFVVNNLISFINENKNLIKNAEHLNIILVGPSGVGKSTLINTILKLEKKIKTDIGKPQTQEIEFHESKTIPFLRLVDSKGIEKNEESGVFAICKSISDFISKQLKNKDSDKYIHCIWYCWTGTRLEDTEVKVLNNLSKQYQLETLPVIIVYTNAIDVDQIKRAKQYIFEELHLKNEFIDVLATPKNIQINQNNIYAVEAHGIDLLITKSIDLAKNAIKSSCYEGLIGQIKESIKKKINELTKKLEISVGAYVDKIVSGMNENNKIEELYRECKKVILDVLYKYLLLNPDIKTSNFETSQIKFDNIEFSISNESLLIIENFVKDYFQLAINSYTRSLNAFLLKYAQELCKKIIDFQIQYNAENKNLLSSKWTTIGIEDTIKGEIYDNLCKKAELAALKNSFSFLTNPIIKSFDEYFINLYIKGMEHNIFKQNAVDAVKITFNEIEKKIEKYNESFKTPKNNDSNNEDPNTSDKPAPTNTVGDDIDNMLNF